MIDRISIENLSKTYNYVNYIFKKLNYNFQKGQTIAITGKNGSGKSTLIKILAGLLTETKGTVNYYSNNKTVALDNNFSFSAPYINLYEDLTPAEHFRMSSELRGKEYITDKVETLLENFKLTDKKDEVINSFSSGMKQRIKLIHNFIYEDSIIFLDEPSTNIDNEGLEVLKSEIDLIKDNRIILIASNDNREISWCNNRIEL